MLKIVAITLVVSLLTLAGCKDRKSAASSSSTPASRKSMITLQDLQGMFANMRTETKWDIDGEMLWGYLFTDPDPKKLEGLVEPLTRDGYRYVNLYETDDKSTHFLHIERVETHTPESLHARNAEFYSLAAKFSLESYDGMDVGSVKKE